MRHPRGKRLGDTIWRERRAMKQSDFDRRLERHLDELRWLYMEL